MISGFPSGAKYTVDLYNRKLISLDTANKSIMYSHFPNPLFVLGSINLILNDYSLAFKILLSVIISNFIICLLFQNKTDATTITYSAPDNFSDSLIMSINNSFQTMFLVYGISLFFYLISTIITKYSTTSPNIYIIICGLFDLTQGVFSTVLINNNIIRAIFILIFISFGSLSIHMQVNGILSKSNIRYKYFLLGRILGSIIAIIVFLIMLYLLN